jgi:glycosyltransferase involved in cell wall biosynthesis
MPINALVSIIIPVFNREEFLTETINSVIGQTYTNWELLLVDDGSTDRSIQIAQEFANKDTRIKSIQRDRAPKGAPTCRNIGFERATGKYIQFFDSDDLLLPNAMTVKVNILRKEPKLDFVVSKTAFLNGDGSFELPDQRLFVPSSFREFLSKKSIFYTPGPLFRYSFLKEQDICFDTTLVRHQEFEFYSRLMSKMPLIKIVDEVHCYYRLHSHSIKSLSDLAGKLYYRRTKLEALSRLNRNTKFKEALAIRDVFNSYAVTTLKSSLYSIDLKTSAFVLKWILELNLSICLSGRIK